MSVLVRLYPTAWRARYGDEFEALLVERRPSRRDLVDILVGAVDARLWPQVNPDASRRQVQITDRLAGAAAISGGLVWSASYIAAAVTGSRLDLGFLIVIAIGLMVLSLPGRYLLPHARLVALGTAGVALSLLTWFAELLPWGPIVLVPIITVAVTLGPGALALAAARAGLSARDRWRLIIATMPWPLAAGLVLSVGLLPESVMVPLAILSVLPMGLAWIATGARIARGASTINAAGGIA